MSTWPTHGCRLEGLQGIEALRGAALPWEDLLGLAPALAGALGIAVLGDGEDPAI
jgi:hypothetical protein